jgi:hypothetical protein
MAAAINIDDLNAELGAHVRQDYPGILTQLLLVNYPFLSYMQEINDVTDEIVLTQFFTGSILQPGNKDTFNPKKLGDFKPRTGKVRPAKFDLSWTPTDITNLWKSYLGYKAKMAGEGREDATTLPFANFFMAQIIASVKHDIATQVVYKGVYNPAGTTPVDTVNGVKAIINACIADGSIPAGQVLTGAAITDATAVDALELLTDKVTTEMEALDLICLVDPKVKRSYLRDYRNTYGSNTANTSYEKTIIEGSNIPMVTEIGLSGSGLEIITPRKNLLWLTNTMGGADKINVEKEKRNLHMFGDLEFAPEIARPDLVVVRKLAA